MSFRITYKRLFTVEILHDYFLNQGSTPFEDLDPAKKQSVKKKYDIRNALQVSPTLETEQIMRDHNLLYRQNARGFFVGARLDEVALNSGLQKPLIPLETPFRLTFGLAFGSPYFLNYTSLPLLASGYEPYFFSNRAGNDVHLSKPIAAYDSAVAYQAGDLHVDDVTTPTQIFEALRNTGPGGRVGADWMAAAVVQPYATRSDLQPIYPSIFQIDVSAASQPSVNVEIRAAGEADPVLVQPATGLPTVTQFSVDLRTLIPGVYDLTVKDGGGSIIETDRSGPFLLDDELFAVRVFGVIQIEHDPSVSDEELHLVDLADQTLRSPTFTLGFKNRSTFWRYIFNSDQTPAGLGEFEPDPLPGDDAATETRRFKTTSVKPLTEAVEELTKFDTTELLPNPSVNLVKPDRTDKQIYSETFLQN